MFKSTQIGWAIIFIILGIMTILVFTIEKSAFQIAGGICIVILLLTYRLSITIDKNWLRFSMGIGLIQGKYAINDILDCKAVSYMPLGWGVRFRPGRIIFNVSGTKALELTIKGKSLNVWLGSDDPEMLVRIIREIKLKKQK